MPKSKETFEKVAAFYKKKGDRYYAQAKNNPGEEYKFGYAKKAYGTAKRAKESAEKAE